MNKIYLLTNETLDLLNNMSTNDFIKFKCIKCGKECRVQLSKKSNIPRFKTLLCSNCHREMTSLKLYGTNNVSKNPVIVNKIKNTTSSKRKEISAAIKMTWNNKSLEEKEKINNKRKITVKTKFGGLSSQSSPEVQIKTKQTKKERYGDENYTNREKSIETYKLNHNGLTPSDIFKSEEFKNHCKSIYLNNLGVDNPLKSKEIREKAKETKNKKYGNPYWNNIEKRKITCKQKYNNYSYFGSNSFFEYMLNKYGSKASDYDRSISIDKRIELYGSVVPNWKYLYYGITFQSSWELAVWIYCIDHNIPIIRDPCMFEYKDFENNFHKYIPDFSINGKLVEIKGSQFFNSNGTMRFPYNKKKVNGEWINMTIEEKKYMNDLYERKHQCGLANGVEFWKESDCKKYIEYCNIKYPGWNTIYRKDNFYNPSYWCFNIVPNGTIQPMYFMSISQQGINPYDIDKDKKYYFVSDKGLTPFDIKFPKKD